MKQWLDSKRIQVDSIVMSAELEAIQNVSYIRGLNMIIGQKVNTPLDSADLLETVQSSLKMRWRIKVDDNKYYFDVKFDKYLYFVQDGLSRRVHLLNKVNFSSIQPKRYDDIYVNRKPIPPLYITQMFFCELVTLLSDEWIPDYQGLWLNLTGTGNGTFLGDAEFNLRKTADGTWQVQICVEDFKYELANTVTSFANILSQRNSCLLFLYACVICVTVNR